MVWRNMRNFFYAQSPAEDDPVRMVDVWVKTRNRNRKKKYTCHKIKEREN